MNKKISLKDYAYEYIKDAIITQEFKPNDPIQEQTIADILHISRTPVREALKMLCSEGFIVTYPFQGNFVAHITVEDLKEVLALRKLFELWTIQYSYDKIQLDELDLLEENFIDYSKSGNWTLYHKTDSQLHYLIVERSGSPRATNLYHTITDQLDWFRNCCDKIPDEDLSVQEHLDIIHAIYSRDLSLATEMLEKHLCSVETRYIRAFHF